MTGLSYGIVDEHVVDGRCSAGALDDGVVGGGVSGEDAGVVVHGTRRGEGGCEGSARGVRGVKVAREEAVVWLQVTPEVLHAADLLHPLMVSDLRVKVDIENEQATDMPKWEKGSDLLVAVEGKRGFVRASAETLLPCYNETSPCSVGCAP